MRRIFLCHSSADKPFVGEVASRLGRAKVAYDDFYFAPGEDFRDAIREALDASAVFVFFVSLGSLESLWCQFELDEAEYRSLHGGLSTCLAALIEPGIEIGELPAWLRRAKVATFTTPSQAARHVEGVYFDTLHPDERRPFVGRLEDIQRGVRKLTLDDPRPRLILVSGLGGVGRRTYLSHLAHETLRLNFGPEIMVEETDSIEDIYIRLVSELNYSLSRKQLANELDAFRSLANDEQVDAIVARLITVATQGQLPFLNDTGGLLTPDGVYRDEYVRLFERFLANDEDVYLGVVHRRVPSIPAQISQLVFVRRIKPLELVDSQTLLVQLLRNAGLNVSTEKAKHLAEWVGGYPPAAYFAVELVERYGIDVLLGNGAQLADFSTKRFARFLDALALPDVEWRVLDYLTSESRLPLSAIAIALDLSVEAAAAAIRSLMDKSLLEEVDGEYATAPPIQFAILRTRDGLTKADYEAVVRRFEGGFWDEETAPPISVVDATLRACLRAGRLGKDAYGDIIRPSLLISAAEEMYHRREYETALQYAERAETVGGAALPILEVMVKAFAQLERFSKTSEPLRQVRLISDRRYWYLRGFIARKEGKFERAVEALQRAMDLGEKSMPVLRDLADSLYRLGDLASAKRHASHALRRDKSNLFVLDLVARIAIDSGTETEVQEALTNLENADLEQQFILHRRATYLLKRVRTREATREAVRLCAEACARRDAPPEAYLVWANALIEDARYDEFRDVLVRHERKFGGNRRPDLRVGLECKAALRKGDWREAEAQWKKLRHKDTETHQALHRQWLRQKLRDGSILIADRNAAEASLAQLNGDDPAFADEASPLIESRTAPVDRDAG